MNPTRKKMNQLVFSIWTLSFCILLTGFIFIYCEYFRGKIPERKKQFALKGALVTVINPNPQHPPLSGTIIYGYTKGKQQWFSCRFINDRGNIKVIELLDSELTIKTMINHD